jgi:membrane protease YdiL (CAAX protease family)
MSDFPIPDPVRFPQALDIQHDTDPSQDHGIARRIPHLGHAALFFAIIGICVLFATLIVIVPAMILHPAIKTDKIAQAQLGSLAMLLGYGLTFAIAFPVFPLLWKHSFLDGIHWTWRAARLRWWKLILLGFALSAVAQLAESFVKVPKDIDILKLLNTPLAAWITAISGALIAPVVEEIGFRGFLLPAFATAYDWLSLERTPAARDRWQRTTGHTRSAWILATVVSSAAFAALHGFQLHWAVGPVIILFFVAIVLSVVRIRFRSVAASALVHVSYNSLLFIEMFIKTGGFRHLDKLVS